MPSDAEKEVEKPSAAAAASQLDASDDEYETATEWNPRTFPPYISLIILMLLAYGGVWFLAGKVVAPGGASGTLIPDGAVWSVIFIWIGAQCGGAAATALKLPPLLGMLLSGRA
jgi:hypothetical protein